jgi:hypothetical protein
VWLLNCHLGEKVKPVLQHVAETHIDWDVEALTFYSEIKLKDGNEVIILTQRQRITPRKFPDT